MRAWNNQILLPNLTNNFTWNFSHSTASYLIATPLIFSPSLCLSPSISCSYPHLFPLSSLALSPLPPTSCEYLSLFLPPLQVTLRLLLSSSRYHFIGLLVPLEMPNDKQSKPSEPLPCCPHRAAESKQTGYELKHSHSPPPTAHHKSSYRI